MKVSRSVLRKLISEEISMLREWTVDIDEDDDDYSPGDLIEISVSDDGYSTSLKKIDNDNSNYQNTRGFYTSAKMLVKVLQVATPGQGE